MKTYCVACGACISACPTDSITSSILHGQAIINANSNSCTNCKACTSVCPVLDYLSKSPIPNKSNNPDQQVFIGNSTSAEFSQNAASGGLVTTLCNYLLEKHEIDCVMTCKMSGTQPVPFIAKNATDLKEAAGSIYFPTWTLKSAQQIREQNQKIAIVGLPCQIKAARKLISKGFLKQDNVKYLFGLRCYHINQPWYLNYIVGRMLNLNSAEVTQITSRRHGWQGGIEIKDKSGTYNVPLVFSWKTGLGVFNPMSLDRLNAQQGCIICKDRDSTEADITFAEAWFTTGKSLAISRTQKGLNLLNEATSKRKISLERAGKKNLPHLVEGEDAGYAMQQQVMSEVAEFGLLNSYKKYGAATLPAVLPSTLIHSPYMRRIILFLIPPKAIMSAIGFYSKVLNKFILK
jgi:coenzyme F420 hydrogenase subunit beta